MFPRSSAATAFSSDNAVIVQSALCAGCVLQGTDLHADQMRPDPLTQRKGFVPVKEGLKGENVPFAIPIIENNLGRTECPSALSSRVADDLSEEVDFGMVAEPLVKHTKSSSPRR